MSPELSCDQGVHDDLSVSDWDFKVGRSEVDSHINHAHAALGKVIGGLPGTPP